MRAAAILFDDAEVADAGLMRTLLTPRHDEDARGARYRA